MEIDVDLSDLDIIHIVFNDYIDTGTTIVDAPEFEAFYNRMLLNISSDMRGNFIHFLQETVVNNWGLYNPVEFVESLDDYDIEFEPDFDLDSLSVPTPGLDGMEQNDKSPVPSWLPIWLVPTYIFVGRCIDCLRAAVDRLPLLQEAMDQQMRISIYPTVPQQREVIFKGDGTLREFLQRQSLTVAKRSPYCERTYLGATSALEGKSLETSIPKKACSYPSSEHFWFQPIETQIRDAMGDLLVRPGEFLARIPEDHSTSGASILLHSQEGKVHSSSTRKVLVLIWEKSNLFLNKLGQTLTNYKLVSGIG